MIEFSYPVKQDEVEAARESCMEEECERVEAEIQKERVHNENRMLKVFPWGLNYFFVHRGVKIICSRIKKSRVWHL